MRSPNKVYLWKYEDTLSQRWYRTENKALESCVRKYKLPQSFGIYEYVNTSVDCLIEYISDIVRESKTQGCVDRANAGVYSAKEKIRFVDELLKVIE